VPSQQLRDRGRSRLHSTSFARLDTEGGRPHVSIAAGGTRTGVSALHGQSTELGKSSLGQITAGPSTPPSDSLCESDGSARDDKFLLDWRAGTRFRAC